MCDPVARILELGEKHPDRFASRTGEAAKAVGRHWNATVWSLTRPSESHESDNPRADSTEACLTSDFPYREVRHESDDTHTAESDSDSAESDESDG